MNGNGIENNNRRRSTLLFMKKKKKQKKSLLSKKSVILPKPKIENFITRHVYQFYYNIHHNRNIPVANILRIKTEPMNNYKKDMNSIIKSWKIYIQNEKNKYFLKIYFFKKSQSYSDMSVLLNKYSKEKQYQFPIFTTQYQISQKQIKIQKLFRIYVYAIIFINKFLYLLCIRYISHKQRQTLMSLSQIKEFPSERTLNEKIQMKVKSVRQSLYEIEKQKDQRLAKANSQLLKDKIQNRISHIYNIKNSTFISQIASQKEEKISMKLSLPPSIHFSQQNNNYCQQKNYSSTQYIKPNFISQPTSLVEKKQFFKIMDPDKIISNSQRWINFPSGLKTTRITPSLTQLQSPLKTQRQSPLKTQRQSPDKNRETCSQLMFRHHNKSQPDISNLNSSQKKFLPYFKCF